MAPKRDASGSTPGAKRFRLSAKSLGEAIDLDEEPKAKAKAKPKAEAKSRAKVEPLKANDAKPGLPLEGITMVFTGEMDQISRKDAEEKAKAAGAKVMGAVSGNVQFLVAGSRLDDGRPVEETNKYKKVMELKEKGKKHPEILTEAQFLERLPDASSAGAMAKALPAPLPAPAGPSYQSWVDRWAPRDMGELIGNASVVRKLTEWLRDWQEVVIKGRAKKAGFKPGGGMPENINARAALISGPPGIGKTTTCRLVAQLHGGYEVLEYNASDARGQKIIEALSQGIADNRTLSFDGRGKAGLTKKAVIIMDEVDGMGAGDRGGMAALNRMVKKTRNPVICICNDSHSQKVRSLAFNCYDLKFTRPSRTTVAQRCAQIANSEGLQVEPNALEALAESCGSDMRMVLNHLQILTKSESCMSQGVNYMEMKEKIRQMNKDQEIMLSTFDACKKLLNTSESKGLSYRDRLEMFFVDHSIMGLLVHENYLNSVAKKFDAKPELAILERCAASADLMAFGDVVGGRIRDHQEWSLLPDVGLFSAVYPAYLTNGFVGFPSFPSFLGKYSSQSRMRRLATELQTHLKLSSTASRKSLLTSPYADLLYKKLLLPLLAGGEPAEAVKETVALLDAYGLRKEHLIEHLTELRQHLGGADRFKEVDPKVKAAMTREFNTGGHAVKVMIPSAGKKRKASAMEENPDEVGEDVEKDKVKQEEEDKEGSEDEGGSASLIKIKGMAKVKAKAKAEGKAKAKAEAKAKAKAEAKAKEAAKEKAPKAKAKGRAKGK